MTTGVLFGLLTLAHLWRVRPVSPMRQSLEATRPDDAFGVVTDNEAAFEAIRQVHEAWLDAELRGDIESILRLCTPDVRWLAPGRPVLEGREAGRQLLEGVQVELLDIRAGDLRIEHSGELAFKTSRYESRYRAGGQEEVACGTHLWILRREGVAWRVALVTWQVELMRVPLGGADASG
jgi:ketosteroid isomerase-like protein